VPAVAAASAPEGLNAFAHRDLNAFSSDVEAYHQLMLDLVHAQVDATNRVLIPGTLNKIFVDGGFSKNELYMNLMAKAYPSMEVYASSVAQATALGAALALHQVWNEGPVPDHLIELRRYGYDVVST
jgi:glycerol kinase